MNPASFFRAVIGTALLAAAARAEYRTPGTGVIYTFEELVLLAGDAFQETDYGLVLHDRVIVSASDGLQVAGGELYVATPEAHDIAKPYAYPAQVVVTPCIVIEGTLSAQGWTLKSVPGVQDNVKGHGLMVNGLGHQGAAAAVVSDCTFDGLLTGLVVRGAATAEVEGSFFTACTAGAVAYMDGAIAMRNCFFRDTGFESTGRCTLRLEDSRFEGGGITLNNSLDGTVVSRCLAVGGGGIGLMVFGQAKASVVGNQIGGFDYGVFFANASGTRLENNILWGNRESAVVLDATSTPVLRRNRIVHNALEVSSPVGTHPRPAVFVMEGSAPDLGTAADHGFNTIRYNGALALYHAGTEPLSAVGNDWGVMSETAVEDLIYHRPDDDPDADGNGTLSGTVLFLPVRHLEGGPPCPDLDLNGLVEGKDLLLFQREWHRDYR